MQRGVANITALTGDYDGLVALLTREEADHARDSTRMQAALRLLMETRKRWVLGLGGSENRGGIEAQLLL